MPPAHPPLPQKQASLPPHLVSYISLLLNGLCRPPSSEEWTFPGTISAPVSTRLALAVVRQWGLQESLMAYFWHVEPSGLGSQSRQKNQKCHVGINKYLKDTMFQSCIMHYSGYIVSSAILMHDFYLCLFLSVINRK